jgi:hypothetical protein
MSYVSGSSAPGNGYANQKARDYKTKHRLFDAACGCKRLTPYSKLAFGNLLFKHYWSESGQCFVSEETIARALGTDARQVRRCIKQLREEGWIHVQRRFNQSSVYSFAWDRADAHESVEPARKTEASTPFREFEAHLKAVETALGSGMPASGEGVERLERVHAAALSFQRVTAPVDDEVKARWLDELLECSPKSKRGAQAWRRAMLESMRRGACGVWHLEHARQTLFEGKKGFRPEFSDIREAIAEAEKPIKHLGELGQELAVLIENGRRALDRESIVDDDLPMVPEETLFAELVNRPE